MPSFFALYLTLLTGKLGKVSTGFIYPELNLSPNSYTINKDTKVIDIIYSARERHNSYIDCIKVCSTIFFLCKSISIQSFENNTVDCKFYAQDFPSTTTEIKHMFISKKAAKCSQSCNLKQNPCGKCECYPSCNERNRRQHICNCTLAAGEATNCLSHYNRGFVQSGIFLINPTANSSFPVLCEMNKNEVQMNNSFYQEARTEVGKGKLLSTLNIYKEYAVTFEIMINEIPKNDHRNIFRLSQISMQEGNSQINCGDTNPGVWISYQAQLLIISCVNGNGNTEFRSSNTFPLHTFQKIRISQEAIGETEDYLFKINVSDSIYEFLMFNKIAKDFLKMNIYASDPWYENANGVIRNLSITTSIPALNFKGGIPIMTRFATWKDDFWNKDYAAYKNGFGLVNQRWIGLENLYQLTKVFETHMRVDYSFIEGSTLSVIYYNIKVNSEEQNYELSYGKYDARGTGEVDRLNSQGAKFQMCLMWWANNGCTASTNVLFPTSSPQAGYGSSHLLWIEFLLYTN